MMWHREKNQTLNIGNMENRIFYSLNIEDIQAVASEELERVLTDEEIEIIINEVPERIPWYEIIADVMYQKIDAK
jgi:hypothetical protein